MRLLYFLFSTLQLHFAAALRYDPQYVGFNLNENKTAIHPRDYWGEWPNHTYHPSPSNWRFPFYALTIDRFVDGEPTNNEANGSVFEHNWMSNQFRFGGDVAGILSDLDYVQGIGARAIYFTGSMMLNMPWSPDGYGPLDFTLLDQHHGNIADWRALVDEIHNRGMYVILDNTMATMGNLLGYKDFLNTSVQFNFDEYDYVYKDSGLQYHDFTPGNARNSSCKLPRIWEQNGYPETREILDQYHGCRDSEFDMYGDIKGTGAYPSYINQLSRFASVQDRLREWRPDVLEKIKVMSCMQIAMLDIDGFRMDKAVQTTIDALAEFSDYQRQCARRLGKDNFLMVGEIVADPKLAAIYFGRGKQPNQQLTNLTEAVLTSNLTDPDLFVREYGMTALDGAAFHYDIYGSLTRFLGLDGPWGSLGVDWVELWNGYLATHDLVNANTGQFDPRHIFGTTNQDVFRWPALANGAQRQLLGLFVTTLELPGIPMILYGEEQEFYVLENQATDYIFGRTPFTSSRAWQIHGCYNLGAQVYHDMPFNKSAYGCHDDSVSLDHRDPSHPMRNVLKRMYELREQYPVLNDGFNLTTLSQRVYDIYLPGSQGMPSPHGIWSVFRGRSESVQDFTGTGQGNQPVWLLFHNEDRSVTYNFDCGNPNSSSPTGSMFSAFPAGTTVKNLFYPYEEYELDKSVAKLGLEGSIDINGCLPQVELRPWEFKAFVPKATWQRPRPVITTVIPRHDARLLASAEYSQTETVVIQIHFSVEMDCSSVLNSLQIESTTQLNQSAVLNKSSVNCSLGFTDPAQYVGQVAAEWVFTAELDNVAHGVHTYTVKNATTADGTMFTNTRDKFMFRIGDLDNPMVFPISSNYTQDLLHRNLDSGELQVTPRAAGADMVRYSTNWGSSFSPWQKYTGENISIQKQAWSGTKDQEWHQEHVILHYWSRMTGSSDHVQHSDIDREGLPPRRWPHAWVEGVWNQWGSDGGIRNQMYQQASGDWTFDLYTEWPTNASINVWGMNPDGQIDKSAAYGDVDGDGVLDWVAPDSLAHNILNIFSPPATGGLGYRIMVNDGNFSYTMVPCGSLGIQAAIMLIICILPVLTGIMGVRIFMSAFYKVKFNKIGFQTKRKLMKIQISRPFGVRDPDDSIKLLTESNAASALNVGDSASQSSEILTALPQIDDNTTIDGTMTTLMAANAGSSARRTVLIATMEYEIEDWNVKVKIGGLGVMASLVAQNLNHQNLIWVVPCAGDVDYPFDEDDLAEPMQVNIMGQPHIVLVHYHVLNNITFILLEAPIFAKRTKSEPYPSRMDDMESAVYYSAWNQCIAESIYRFAPDIYHINDYHGAVAPLYLLPSLIPCCLSLHNAEFQGLWPLKTSNQLQEMCRIFDLSEDIVKKYVQFGEIFNLLHAGASYLRIHQSGFGAVGVSKKYSGRSLTRYPIFWGLDEIGSLPNPDPTDIAPLSGNTAPVKAWIDLEQEGKRGEFRRQAQEWAGLEIDDKAELFIFIGRWSQQKGIDLIADVFPSILESYKNTQLICVGPVIDLYGKFAALKLEKLMAQFPGRVYSKPEFTTLPPYIFSGAEFALMPSRDEPFGLVAVEFGRKGALCVGSRVGGFGHMPGWWYTVEAVTSKHLLSQFKAAISAALKSDYHTRALMRAYSSLRRFPVAQWLKDLEILHTKSIDACSNSKSGRGLLKHLKVIGLRGKDFSSRSEIARRDHDLSPASPGLLSPPSPVYSRPNSPFPSRTPSPMGNKSPLALRSTTSGGRASPFAPPEPSEEVELPRLLSSRYPYSPSASGDSSPSVSVDAVHLQGPSAHDSTAMNTPIRSVFSENLFNRLSITAIQSKNKASTLLQNNTPAFVDHKNTYYDKFSDKLDASDPKLSESTLCIEEYIMQSEKDWFGKYHSASLQNGGSASKSTISLLQAKIVPSRLTRSETAPRAKSLQLTEKDALKDYVQFLGSDYQAPTGLRRLLRYKIGSWNLAYLLLAFGQIISVNSYQLTLLTGEVGQPADKLYALCSIYLVSSLTWWILYRRVKAVYILATPFLFFGACFFVLAMAVSVKNPYVKGQLYNFGAGLYTVGAAAGCMYFSLNFGTEGGTPSQTWAFRACVIAGTQQLLVAFLWYWGSYLNGPAAQGRLRYAPSSAVLAGVAIPLALLMWVTGAILFLGLPDYYRQRPGVVPSFYRAVCRREIVIWFWVMVVLQGFFLSTPYSRNWSYLWSSQNAPRWATGLLVIFFFVLVWAALLAILGHLSKQHSWIIPIFAVGLLAPRWSQMLWGISGIGYHIPWAGAASGALIGRSVWLWLGVLDALQGVGFGMILLMTLTRLHITFTLVGAQSIGAFVTIIARLCTPDKDGPGTVFPNAAGDSLAKPWFWIGLTCQLVICIGYLKFFRKAQLMKP